MDGAQDLAARFLASADLSARTRTQYREALSRAFALSVERGIDPVQMSGSEAADLISELAGQLAPATYNFRLGLLDSFFDYLVKQGVRERNPFADMARLPNIKTPRDAFTVLELRSLLMEAKTPQMRAIVCLLGISGLQLEQVLGARAGDFRSDRSPAELRLSNRRGRSGPILLPPITTSAMEAIVAERPRGSLFVNRYGDPLTPGSFRRQFTTLARHAGIDRPVSPAMLTHSLRYVAVEQGFTLRSIANAFPDAAGTVRYLIKESQRQPGPTRDEAPFRLAALIERDIATTTSLLAQAERLLYVDDVHPAVPAALAGAVLERHLREWAQIRGAVIGSRSTIVSLTSALRRDRFISEAQTQWLHNLAERRDKAAHGRFDEVDSDFARQLIQHVREFIDSNPVPA